MTVLSINPSWTLPDPLGHNREAAMVEAEEHFGTASILFNKYWIDAGKPDSKAVQESVHWRILLDANNMKPFPQISLRGVPDGATFDVEHVRMQYMRHVKQVLTLYPDAEYMCLSMEHDAMLGRADWVFINRLMMWAYNELKCLRPDVTFFLSLQFEAMLRDGTYKLLGDYEYMDACGITTYPHLTSENTPLQMHPDHYQHGLKATKLPIVVAEAGYPSQGVGRDERQQADFVRRLRTGFFRDRDLRMLNWQRMYDNTLEEDAFDHIGSHPGLPSWEEWA